MVMMGGGLMQLAAAFRSTDVYLVNDNIYKVVYRRHCYHTEEIIKNRLIHNKDRLICPIEYTNINIGDIYQHCSKCNHNFCNDSITKWLNINNSCPMCRNKWSDSTIYINKEEISDNTNEIDQIETSAGVKTQ